MDIGLVFPNSAINLSATMNVLAQSHKLAGLPPQAGPAVLAANEPDLPVHPRAKRLQRRWPRRGFLAVSGITLLAWGASCAPTPRREWTWPKDHPLASFDREMEQFMAARTIPGGALAVVKHRRLIYARGYGWGDRERQGPVQPDALFRIASVSKPITAVAVMQLVQRGQLKLEDRAFEIVRLEPLQRAGQVADGRLARITIRQLLQHTAGWDTKKSGDPMFRPVEIARAAGEAPPPAPETVIRYMLGQPLDFAPGATHAYSNFGYCVLGRVIERITGRPYEDYVKRQVLAPAVVQSMRVGASLAGQAAPGEVKYYTAKNAEGPSVFARVPGQVPRPYGTFCLETMDAHGGWIASVLDLARFAAALDEPGHSPLLRAETFPQMYAPPPAPVARDPQGRLLPAYYACGWMVRPQGADGKANYWHAGSLPGGSSLLVRLANGLSWAVLFNQRSDEKNLPDSDIDGALHRAAAAVKDWPQRDLFDQFLQSSK